MFRFTASTRRILVITDAQNNPLRSRQRDFHLAAAATAASSSFRCAPRSAMAANTAAIPASSNRVPLFLLLCAKNSIDSVRFFGNKSDRKVNGQPPNVVFPVVNESMIQELAVLERRFERIEKEGFGPKRGIETTREIVKEERLEKRATKEVANIYLNNWLYRRYALKLGYKVLIDVPGDVVANTLIREGTTVRFHKYKNPKTILKELFRYGESVMQQRYVKKDVQAEQPKPPVAKAANEDPSVWDPTLFAHKWVGKKVKRLGKWRKKKN